MRMLPQPVHECVLPLDNDLIDEYRCLTARCWRLWRRVDATHFVPVTEGDLER